MNWQTENELDADRYVRVRDDAMTYCAEIPAETSLERACVEFALTYDHNGEDGTVLCDAELFVDGQKIESAQFEA